MSLSPTARPSVKEPDCRPHSTRANLVSQPIGTDAVVVTAVTVVIVVVAAGFVVIVATKTVLADVDELASDVDEAGATDELFTTDFAAPPQALKVGKSAKTIRRVVLGGNHEPVISGEGVRSNVFPVPRLLHSTQYSSTSRTGPDGSRYTRT